MPFNARSVNYEIQLPIKGTDRGTVRAKPMALTCPDSRNVRSWDLRDRLGLGKRSGTIAAFTDRAGSAGARRVTGLIRRARISTVVSTSTPFTETPVDTTTGGNTWGAATTSATFGDYGNDFVRYVIDDGAAGVSVLRPNELSDVLVGAGPAYTVALQRNTAAGDVEHPHVASAFYTTNDMTATFNFLDTATGNANTDCLVNQPVRVGPAIRGTDDGTSYVMAMISKSTNTANIVRLEIRTVTGAVASASIANGTDRTLLGSAATTSCVLRCWEEDGFVKASVSWPGALTGPADWTETISVSTSQNVGSKRAAVIGAWVADAASGNWRICTRMQFTKLVPASPEVLTQLVGTETNPTTTDQYFLPSGWRDVAVTKSTGAVALTTGFQSSSASADPTYIAVDDTGNTIHHDTGPTAGVMRMLQATTAAFDENSVYGVDWTTTKALGASPNNEGLGFAWKVSSDGTSYAAIALNTRTSTERSESGIAWFINGRFIYGNSGAAVESSGLTPSSGNAGVPIRAGVRSRWVASSTGVSLYQNGIPVFTYSFSAGEQTALANLSGHGYGAVFSIDSTNYCSDTADIRFVIVSSNPSGVGDPYTQVAVFTPEEVQIGDLRTGLLQDVTGTYLTNGSPSGFFFTGTGKYYAVDGTRSIIIDPATLSASDWTDTAGGTFPAGCHIAALYRGRAILANQDSSPNAYYASRVFNPNDFDNGASPAATSAFAGSNGNIGAPADAITAVIPFNDDYCIFGCSTSIWMLEGDPGYQGAIQNVSMQTGILGPRAYCFDEMGNLYFMGSGGLYRMAKGTLQPENISGHRLAERLDRVDTSQVLVQLAYDAFKSCVHIFLTQVNYDQSIHIVYDTRRDAFWQDVLPQNSDPWSVCEIIGTSDEDRRIIWGGNDGFIRRFDDLTIGTDHTTTYPTDGSSDTATESATSIQPCFIRFSPIENSDVMRELMLTALSFQASSESDTCTWYLLTGDSAEEVGDKTISLANAYRSGDIFGSTTGFSAGHQQVIRVRATAGCHQLVVFQNTSGTEFHLERIMAMFAQTRARR